MNIKRTQTKCGVKSVLTYWYRGKRHRPTLGYDLTPDQEREAALKIIQGIHEQAELPPDAESMTFAQFIPMYLQRMRNNKRATIEGTRRYVIDKHFIPSFGSKRLKDIRLIHGEEFIETRRREGAAEGTIKKECNILSAIMNCAVDHEYLERNRLRKMAVPKGTRRTRIASPDELRVLLDQAERHLAGAILVAINTGLREGKIAEIDQSWIRGLEDGPWLFLPKPRTPKKGNPDKTPLNRLAADALKRDVTYLHGKRVFDTWHTGGRALTQAFTRLTRQCGIVDLHFHDLRHTFSTALENLGVDTRVIDLLMGHKIQGMGETYRHGGPGRDSRLRDAVSALEDHWTCHKVPLKVPLGRHRNLAG